MRTFTHLAFSATVTSAFLCTSDPFLIGIGAMAGCLPDVDTSNSFVGRILRPVSRFVENYGHRQITHSLLGSLIFCGLTIFSYFLLNYLDGSKPFWELLAANIGYSSGWLLDAGSKTGVPIFYPSNKRLVFPFDPNFRLSTGSLSEKVFGMVVLCALFAVLYVNGAGGALANFTNFLGYSKSAVEVYRDKVLTNEILVNVRGINKKTAEKFERENLPVLDVIGETDLLVKIGVDEILQIGESANAHVKVSHVETLIGEPRKLVVRSFNIPDEVRMSKIFEKLSGETEIFGMLKVDSASCLNLQSNQDPLIFRKVQILKESENCSLEFRGAKLSDLSQFEKFWITGNLLIRERKGMAR